MWGVRLPHRTAIPIRDPVAGGRGAGYHDRYAMSLVFESAAVPDDLVRRIAERFSPDKIILFGSRARGDAGPDSDIDLLVDLAEDRGFTDYLALVEQLEGLFARHVDLVIDRSLSPHFRPYIEREARPL